MKGIEINKTQTRIYFNEDEIDIVIEMLDELSPFVDGYQFSQKFRSGVWDGRKYFFTLNKENGFFTTFIGLAKNLAKKYNFEIQELEDENKFSKEEILQFINSLNLPFEPYDYQIEAVLDIIQNKRMVSILATGSGKSLIIYMALRFLFQQNKKSVLIVPNVALTEQMFSDFKEYSGNDEEFLKNIHKIYSGEEKTLEFPITISTWQSFIKLTEDKLLNDVDGIFIDEAHLVSDIENSLSTILKAVKNASWRIGLTGTIPDNQIARMSLFSTLGELKVKIKPIDLINMGRATPVEINTIFFLYEKHCVNRISNFRSEVKFLEEHKKRNEFISKIALSATKKYGNSILLGNKLEHLILLVKFLIKERSGIDFENIVFIPHLTNGRAEKVKDKFIVYQTKSKNLKEGYNIKNLNDFEIYYMVGEVEKEYREFIRQILDEKENAILVGNYQVLSTGINIKRLNNLILASSTKSFVRVMQSIGRGMRLHDSKEKLRVFDIVDEFLKGKKKNYVYNHFLERLNNSYFFSGFPVIEKEIKIC